MKNWILKNKVMLSAFIAAIVLTLQQQYTSHVTDYRVIGFALFLAVLGVASNKWGGSGWSITGILLNLGGIFTNIYQTGTFTWNEFAMAGTISVLTAIMGALNAPEEPKPTLESIAPKDEEQQNR